MKENRKRIVILGSTGSIGTQTLDVVRANGDLQVTGLAAGSNAELLEQQAREFHPRMVCLWDPERARELAVRLKDTDIKVASGMEGMTELASMEEADTVVTAVVGMIGIRPALAAIEAGKDIALANKETLVTAGHLVMAAAERKGVSILPVDSEHSAIFQCLNGEDHREVRRILLTASGGPFRGATKEQLAGKTPEDALKHPNWVMGRKITIDSATLVNKGLELMEAKWLFGVDLDRIQVVVHPQSVIHSAVEYADGAVIAQLGTPDMKLPIQYALYYPHRRPLAGSRRLDLTDIGQLTFEKPDTDTFEGLALAYEAAGKGGTMPTVYNAANEYAVARFLERKIGFLDIPAMIGDAMARHRAVPDPSVEDILAAEQETCEYLRSKI